MRRTLSPNLLGRQVSQARVELAKLARPDVAGLSRGLRGRTVSRLSRHGKLLIMELDNGSYWTIHLGMTGQVIMSAQRPQAKHLHIKVSFADQGPSLWFRDPRQFGFMAYCPDREALASGPLANMGPDALGLALDVFAERIKGRKAPLKSLLLDQRILAGVGNIYADESLHRACLSPLCRPCDLEPGQVADLHQAIAQVLDQALAQGGSSIRNFVDAEGRPGTFQHAHQVYQRTGQPCPRCGKPIERTVLGGRSTHYCPDCQK